MFDRLYGLVFESISTASADEEKFPIEWRETMSSFDSLGRALREYLAFEQHPSPVADASSQRARLDELKRMFQRELLRPEEFYKFKCSQIKDKLEFLSKTHQRMKDNGQLTSHVVGVLVSNLAGILYQLDIAKDFSALHVTSSHSLYLEAEKAAFLQHLPIVKVRLLQSHLIRRTRGNA